MWAAGTGRSNSPLHPLVLGAHRGNAEGGGLVGRLLLLPSMQAFHIKRCPSPCNRKLQTGFALALAVYDRGTVGPASTPTAQLAMPGGRCFGP
jgi:hypothetical protein